MQNMEVEHTFDLIHLFQDWHGRDPVTDNLRINFLDEKHNVCAWISPGYYTVGYRINDSSALVYVMNWQRLGHRPLPKPMVIYVTDA